MASSTEVFLNQDTQVDVPQKLKFILDGEATKSVLELGDIILETFLYDPSSEPFYQGVQLIGNKKIPNGIYKLWTHPPEDRDYYHLQQSSANNPRIRELAGVVMEATCSRTGYVLSEAVIQIYPPRKVMMRHPDPGLITLNCNLRGNARTTFWVPNDSVEKEETIKVDSEPGDVIVIDGDIDHSVANISRSDYRVVLSMIQA